MPQSNNDTAGKRPQAGVYPLTAAQRGIWFAQHLADSSPISVAQYVEIVGELDTDLLVEACRTASREFGSGHLHLIEIDGEPCQFVVTGDRNRRQIVGARDAFGGRGQPRHRP